MGRFRTRDGVRIHYEVCGRGPVVYVLHGGPENVCETYISDLAPLTDDFTLVFHDYRGSGQSSTAPPETYTFEQLADDLAQLGQALGHHRHAVLAHSMGGFVALQFALRHVSSCARLALVATTPVTVPWALGGRVLSALGPGRTLKALGLGARYLALWSWRPHSRERTVALNAPLRVTQEARPALRATVDMAHPELPVMNDNVPSLTRRTLRVDLRPELRRIACPVSVVYGSRDAVMVAGGELLARWLPDAVVHVLTDIGHRPFIEAPDETFATLRPFLSLAG